MSKGNKVQPIRFDEVLLDRIKEALASKNERVFEEPWSLSKWVRDACWEKLAHLGAAKKQREALRQANAMRRRLGLVSSTADKCPVKNRVKDSGAAQGGGQ